MLFVDEGVRDGCANVIGDEGFAFEVSNPIQSVARDCNLLVYD